jgi:hypothetical protein
MSSPKPKAAKSASAKSAPAAGKAAPVGELSGADKAHFVKAMWEGVGKAPAKSTNGKDAKASGEKPVSKAATARKPAAKTAAAEERPHVEILRKIPAPVKKIARATPESTAAAALTATLAAKLEAGEHDVLTPESFQELMAVLCKLYAANSEADNKFPALSHIAAVSGTDVMIVCGALLKAVDLQVFELGMWQSWTGG